MSGTELSVRINVGVRSGVVPASGVVAVLVVILVVVPVAEAVWEAVMVEVEDWVVATWASGCRLLVSGVVVSVLPHPMRMTERASSVDFMGFSLFWGLDLENCFS